MPPKVLIGCFLPHMPLPEIRHLIAWESGFVFLSWRKLLISPRSIVYTELEEGKSIQGCITEWI